MKITISKPTEITAAAIRCRVPIRYDLEEVGLAPDTYGLDGKVLTWTLDLATRKVRDWPEGRIASAYIKVVDEGSYDLLDGEGNVIASRHQELVPDCVPGEFGDYFAVEVAEDGSIRQAVEGEAWKPSARQVAASFFPG